MESHMARNPKPGLRLVAATLAATIIASMSAPVWATADPNKVVRFAFKIAETAFDPAKQSDRYSNFIIESIFDALLTYDYLARPVKLVPSVAEVLPEITDNGATFTFHLKHGVYFAPDPAFKGKKRELTAQDFVYSIKRFYDPKLVSPYLYLFENKIIGADELRKRAQSGGKFDYDSDIPGLQALDRYTLRFRLKETDYNFLYVLATPQGSVVAREVVEAYGDDIASHPVGTNAYMLKEWRRSSKIVLEANPNYRDETYTGSDGQDAADKAIADNLRGKKLPLVGRVEIAVVEEPQPRWLGFLNKEFEYVEEVPSEFINVATPNGKLAPSLVKAGIRAGREPQMEITITAFFNMEDPVIGGYTPEKVALRRAINLGYNQVEEIQIARKGQAVASEGPIPPGAAGYDPDFRSIAREYDPAKARALLDMFGYVDKNGDGYREQPDGSPLVLEFGSPPTAEYRDLDLIWKKSMDAIGINIKFKKERWPDLKKQSDGKKLQVGSFIAWAADYPDGDNFLSLLYGPNMSPQSNNANFNLPAFNQLYEKARLMPDSPERTQLYQDMTRLFLAYAPWRLGVYRIWTNLSQPWMYNYKKHPIMRENWKFLDIDLDRQRKEMQ
jgi:oligopeptide transport system substrate-binding protein